MKKKINSKNKGSTFERQICVKLKEWTGDEFHRTPGSGSYSTIHKRDDLTGDITCKNPDFKYSIECKKREGWHLEHLLSNQKTEIWAWWKQTVDQCPSGKEPLLIFSKNRTPVYCMSRYDPQLFDRHIVFRLTGPGRETLYIYQFSDLLKLDSKSTAYL